MTPYTEQDYQCAARWADRVTLLGLVCGALLVLFGAL